MFLPRNNYPSKLTIRDSKFEEHYNKGVEYRGGVGYGGELGAVHTYHYPNVPTLTGANTM